MRSALVLFLAGTFAGAHATAPGGLTFDEVVRRQLADPARLARAAELARIERELASTSRHTPEGPALEAEVGPRRIESGAVKVDAVARVDVPLWSGGGVRTDAVDALGATRGDALAADAVAVRLALRTAYLDAWLAQARLAVLGDQLAATDRIVASVRTRVAEGADASYEIALAEGDRLRLAAEQDDARARLGEAWGRLRAGADLPAEPQLLADPGAPDVAVGPDTASRFERGVLARTPPGQAALQSSILALDAARVTARWSLAASAGREGNDEFVTVGAGYRFPARGASQALRREQEAARASIERGAQAESARLDARFRSALDRARGFGPIVPPDTFDPALAAVSLRMELGKERPSSALPVRRQILDAKGAALQRLHDAHVLVAEIDALTAGDAP